MPEKIEIKIEDRAVQEALGNLAKKCADPSPILRVIGERVLRQTEDRFNRQGPAPGGTPWAPLKPATIARKKHRKILTESGDLRGSIRYQLLGKSAVAIGTNKIYGAIHQLGGRTSATIIKPRIKKALFWPGAKHPVKSVRHPGSVIPARHFLGLSRGNSEEIVGIINQYLMQR